MQVKSINNEESAGLVLERLQSCGLIPDAVARRCVLGKTMLFSTLGQAVYPLW